MLSSLNKNFIYRILISVLWFLLLFGLPLTSFPILNRLTGAIVAPFSAIPLALLLVLWMVPYLLDRGVFPFEILPIVYFILVGVIVSAMAYFLDGYTSRGQYFFDQSLRAFFTLGIGFSFYLIFAAFPSDVKIIQQTLLFIYIGGVILILWTLLEVIMLRSVQRARDLPAWVLSVRSALAVQSDNVLFTNRVTGFAYEPSWFVRQFNLVLFPIWLSAAFQRVSLFKVKVWFFQVEDLLLLGGLVVFAFSSPRIGLLAFIASLAYLGVIIFRRVHRKILSWVLRQIKSPLRRLVWIKIGLAFLMVMVMFVFAGSALVGYITVASRWDDRYALLLKESTFRELEIFPLTETRLITIAHQLAFFERIVYWFGGWNIFNDYPFGVGLGNAGFYIVDRMNASVFDSFEIRNLVFRAGHLVNTKNLWTRLLAETGFIGLAMFLSWLYLLWRSAGLIRKSASKVMRIIGLAGQLFLLAYLVESFSMDSFAMPYQWLMAGMISAGGLLVRRELSVKDTPQVLASHPDSERI